MSEWPHSKIAHDVHFAVHALAASDEEFGGDYTVFKSIYYNGPGEMFFVLRDKASGKDYMIAVRERGEGGRPL